ncbi:MAG: acyl-phosphate glycerol 3-phosphate acyltransferase [Bacteroidota bacterium]|jgi:glycerol-3-phosphate acyltransferase PlsY
MIYAVILVFAYLIGSIPTAVWVGKHYFNIDVREHGSKNAGATNTFRILGKKAGWAVLGIDVAKGILAASLPRFLLFETTLSDENFLLLQLSAAFTAVLGHVFPIFAGFRGGKGVATSLGIVIGIHPVAAAICLGIFLVVFVSSRMVSLGAIVAASSFPLVNFFLLKNDSRVMLVFSIVLAVLIVAAHKKNISRLMKGEESKMNLFKK